MTRPLILIIFVLSNLSACSTISNSGPEARVSHMPSKGPVGDTMKRNSERFEGCGKDSVSVQTAGSLKVSLLFTIESDGRVQKAEALLNEPDPDLKSCLVRAVRSIHFPNPPEGKPHTVRYPLTLKAE